MRASVASFPALVLAGHGTRDAAGQASAAALVADVQRLLPGITTTAAYLDHQGPGVPEAVSDVAAAGATRVAVVPLLLTPATHSKTDVAAEVAAARAALPRLTVHYGRPLGPHPALVEALADRLVAAGVDEDDPDTAVVLASAGAADPDANAEVARMARLLLEGRGWWGVEPAYASATRPSVTDVVARLRRLGVPRVVVAPYFLSPGYLLDRVVSQARAAGADLTAAPLAGHPGVSRLVVERYREAVAGKVDHGCDTCMFRAPFRGHADRVGAPLIPRREAVS